MTRPCVACHQPTTDFLRVTRFQINSPEAAEVRAIPFCRRCRDGAGPWFRGWRTTYEPPFLYGHARSSARCSNPACSRRATSVLVIGEPSTRRGSCHEIHVCGQCLELLYSQLFGTFEEDGPWTI